MWKECTNTKCKKILPLYMFYKEKCGQFGLKSECKKCTNQYNKQYWKQYYKKNSEKRKKYLKQWNKENSEKRKVLDHKRKAIKRNAEGLFTAKEWKALCKKFLYVCCKCGGYEPLTVDHIIPLTKGGSNYIDNIQPLCEHCNKSKHTDDTNYKPHWLLNYAL